MATLTNSYGTAAQVAALTPKYGDGGTFTGSTRPTLTTVEDWIDKISAVLNALLQDEGFDIPVTQSDAILILESFIEQEVASVVEGINGLGRFGPSAKSKASKSGRFKLILDDAVEFIQSFGTGLEQLGVVRSRALGDFFYRDTDDAGDDIHPMFQRKAFNWTVRDFDG